MHNFNISISYKSNFFWFTNYKSDIFHFASFSPLLFSRCVSPFLLPVVSPRNESGLTRVSGKAERLARGLRPKTATGRHNGEKERGDTTGEEQRGKWCKMKNVTFIVCKPEKVAFVRYWNVKIVHICWLLWYFLKIVSIHQFMSTISFKTFSGSFSRYWNEILNFLYFFKKWFLSINYARNQF